MLLATKMMIEWLGEEEKASRMENAVAQVIKEGKVRTYDLGGSSTTLDVAHEVASKL
jgi:isocitrate/isopropylmalate dehydrogenase